MENLNVNGVYAKVELNHNGSFVQHPFSYANGFTLTIDDHDFVGMDYSKCVIWLERFMQEECKKLYYSKLDKTLLDKILPIANDLYNASFILLFLQNIWLTFPIYGRYRC